MDPTELYTHDLVFEHEAVAATGVPGPTIRQWARRGKIRRFQGDPRQYAGQGHEYKTMYALPEIEQLAANFKRMPQRRPNAARAA
ncbi:hypothetical protein [Streptomyces sp. NPDC002889]|uniref:hypothetical protein n=1 Tax=Streptomyces sp. NPDC002889 TaxID=3364669 RepID=UPI0036B1E996